MRSHVTARVLKSFATLFAAFPLFAPAAPLRADEAEPADGKPAKKAKADPPMPDVQSERAGIRAPQGFKVELFAAEPMVQNPSAFTIDEHGRFFVVEANRRRSAVLDIRKIQSWLEEDLACRTVADRIAMVKRHYTGKDLAMMTALSDRLRLIEDRDGDGKADHDSVFADGFDHLEDGTAAGVVTRNGTVWFTEIPNLWQLKDTTGSGKADVKKSLAYGFGVRYNYSGHDMHGLRFGPDGRLYFSIADRGAHVERDGKTLIDNPDCGAVYRCDPDGANLELYHTGLRNPQELAFDEFGNLFTGDNNSDGGDASRWVYCVEGGDSGWRIGYQWHTYPVSRGPWNNEKLWAVSPPVPASYRLPPIATPKVSGPSGLTYTGGPGMPAAFRDRFLLVDFRGSAAGGSGVYALKNTPAGASFELSEFKEFVTNVLPSDVEIGWTGGAYVLDWVGGWEPKNQGRIYHVVDPEAAKDPLVAETRKLMDEGMNKRTSEDLGKLLAHADMRVRQAAQFALADRGPAAVPVLAAAAEQTASQLARVHGIWGLGQIARVVPGAANAILPLLTDKDAEVRAQTAKTLGDLRETAAYDGLVKQLRDKSPRVRFFAATALGRIGRKDAAGKIVDLLRDNNDADAYLRHAGVMALVWLNDPSVLQSASADPSPAVRMGALLALRRTRSPDVARFLNDADPQVVLEAARAINDEPIEAGRPALAALLDKPGQGEFVLLRAVNALGRLGTPEAAKALGAFAGKAGAPVALRAEALHVLAEWNEPLGRDRVTGAVLPAAKVRTPGAGKAVLASVLQPILEKAPDPVRVAALSAGTAAGIESRSLSEIIADTKQSPGFRAAALGAMAARKDAKLGDAVKGALSDKEEAVRIAAIRLAAHQPEGLKPLKKFLDGSAREQQAVYQVLADTKGQQADEMLVAALDRFEAGKLPPEAQLDLLTAAGGRTKGPAAKRMETVEAARAAAAKTDDLAQHRECLAGGDADHGGWIFRERQDVACMRCHSIKGVGGNAGPDLAGVLARAAKDYKNPREYILESILYPSKKIAPGFETVTVKTEDDVIAGVFKGEDDKEIRLDVPNQGIMKIDKNKVKSRKGGMSGMPDDISKPLSKQDLRDLVEFLAGQ